MRLAVPGRHWPPMSRVAPRTGQAAPHGLVEAGRPPDHPDHREETP